MSLDVNRLALSILQCFLWFAVSLRRSCREKQRQVEPHFLVVSIVFDKSQIIFVTMI
jgi:hypothetical protein